MAAVACVEVGLPFHAGSPWRRAHLGPNLGLTVLMLVLNFMLTAATLGIATSLQANHVGLLANTALPTPILLVLSVGVLDFASYAVHWLMHRVGWMWRYHLVHHSDPLVDVTTAYRQHPVEGAFRFAFTMLPALALGVPASAVALYRLLSATNALLEHMNVRLWPPLDGWLSWLVVTPNMHKVHHSRFQPETDSNYGNLFALYDRCFRTFTPTARAADVRYGLDGYDSRDRQSLWALLREPYGPDSVAVAREGERVGEVSRSNLGA